MAWFGMTLALSSGSSRKTHGLTDMAAADEVSERYLNDWRERSLAAQERPS
jgi:hypothetical protein